MDISEAKRLKGLEDENARLKRLLADAMLDNAALKDLLGKKLVTPAAKRQVVAHLVANHEMSERRGAVRQMRSSLRYLYPTFVSGGEKAAPLGESGGAGLLVGVAVLEVALRRKVVVDRGTD